MTGGDFGMSVLAESPIDGGRPFREVVPYEVELNTPGRIPVVPDQLVPDRIPFTDVRIPAARVSMSTPPTRSDSAYPSTTCRSSRSAGSGLTETCIRRG
ncbi:MAG TPA: hypothetical protein VGR26_13355 [Acidimicrobiales bacterium]|nr:hypothetical protein [Acidimicrobiales bacterium]